MALVHGSPHCTEHQMEEFEEELDPRSIAGFNENDIELGFMGSSAQLIPTNASRKSGDRVGGESVKSSIQASIRNSKRLLSRVWHSTKTMLSKMKLFILITIYSILGALLFMYLEVPADLAEKEEEYHARLIARENIILNLKRIHEEQSETRYEKWKETVIQFENDLSLDEPKIETAWTFWMAFLYAGTIYTTIGYGNIACKTTAGRWATMIYGIVGIPIMILILGELGRFLIVWVKRAAKFCNDLLFVLKVKCGLTTLNNNAKRLAYNKAVSAHFRCLSPVVVDKGSIDSLRVVEEGMKEEGEENEGEEAEEERPDPPVFSSFVAAVGWILLSAAVFCLWEDWDYFTSVYFFVISLSTIGLGDVTPDHPEYMIATFGVVLVGLALVTVFIDVVKEKLEQIYMRLLNKQLEKYLKEVECGDPEAAARMMSELQEKAKYLFPLMSKSQGSKVMKQFKKEARARGIEVPAVLTHLNPQTGLPAFTNANREDYKDLIEKAEEKKENEEKKERVIQQLIQAKKEELARMSPLGAMTKTISRSPSPKIHPVDTAVASTQWEAHLQLNIQMQSVQTTTATYELAEWSCATQFSPEMSDSECQTSGYGSSDEAIQSWPSHENVATQVEAAARLACTASTGVTPSACETGWSNSGVQAQPQVYSRGIQPEMSSIYQAGEDIDEDTDSAMTEEEEEAVEEKMSSDEMEEVEEWVTDEEDLVQQIKEGIERMVHLPEQKRHKLVKKQIEKFERKDSIEENEKKKKKDRVAVEEGKARKLRDFFEHRTCSFSKSEKSEVSSEASYSGKEEWTTLKDKLKKVKINATKEKKEDGDEAKEEGKDKEEADDELELVEEAKSEKKKLRRRDSQERSRRASDSVTSADEAMQEIQGSLVKKFVKKVVMRKKVNPEKEKERQEAEEKRQLKEERKERRKQRGELRFLKHSANQTTICLGEQQEVSSQTMEKNLVDCEIQSSPETLEMESEASTSTAELSSQTKAETSTRRSQTRLTCLDKPRKPWKEKKEEGVQIPQERPRILSHASVSLSSPPPSLLSSPSTVPPPITDTLSTLLEKDITEGDQPPLEVVSEITLDVCLFRRSLDAYGYEIVVDPVESGTRRKEEKTREEDISEEEYEYLLGKEDDEEPVEAFTSDNSSQTTRQISNYAAQANAYELELLRSCSAQTALCSIRSPTKEKKKAKTSKAGLPQETEEQEEVIQSESTLHEEGVKDTTEDEHLRFMSDTAVQTLITAFYQQIMDEERGNKDGAENEESEEDEEGVHFLTDRMSQTAVEMKEEACEAGSSTLEAETQAAVHCEETSTQAVITSNIQESQTEAPQENTIPQIEKEVSDESTQHEVQFVDGDSQCGSSLLQLVQTDSQTESTFSISTGIQLDGVESGDSETQADFAAPETIDAETQESLGTPESVAAVTQHCFLAAETVDAVTQAQFVQPETIDSETQVEYTEPETADSETQAQTQQPLTLETECQVAIDNCETVEEPAHCVRTETAEVWTQSDPITHGDPEMTEEAVQAGASLQDVIVQETQTSLEMTEGETQSASSFFSLLHQCIQTTPVFVDASVQSDSNIEEKDLQVYPWLIGGYFDVNTQCELEVDDQASQSSFDLVASTTEFLNASTSTEVTKVSDAETVTYAKDLMESECQTDVVTPPKVGRKHKKCQIGIKTSNGEGSTQTEQLSFQSSKVQTMEETSKSSVSEVSDMGSQCETLSLISSQTQYASSCLTEQAAQTESPLFREKAIQVGKKEKEAATPRTNIAEIGIQTGVLARVQHMYRKVDDAPERGIAEVYHDLTDPSALPSPTGSRLKRAESSLSTRTSSEDFPAAITPTRKFSTDSMRWHGQSKGTSSLSVPRQEMRASTSFNELRSRFGGSQKSESKKSKDLRESRTQRPPPRSPREDSDSD